MKPMKVVYLAECESYSRAGNDSQMYMGERSWSVGEKFSGEFVQGVVSTISEDVDGGYAVWVTTQDNKLVQAIYFPIHAVLRIYYGDE